MHGITYFIYLLILFIKPNITNLPQGALQSVQHTTPSFFRYLIRIRRKKTFKREKMEELHIHKVISFSLLKTLQPLITEIVSC